MGKRATKEEAKVAEFFKGLLAKFQKKSAQTPTRSEKPQKGVKRLKSRSRPLQEKPTESQFRSKKFRAKIEKSPGPRMAARKKRKSHGVIIILAVASCLLIFFLVIVFLRSPYITSLFNEESAIVKKSAEKPKNKTLLFIGAKKEDRKEKAARLALVIIKEGEDKITGWSIPENTFVIVPGCGFEKISAALDSGVSTTTATVKNFLGVEVNYYAKLSYKDYKRTVSKMRLKRALEEAEQTNLNRARYAEFSIRFGKVNPQDVNLIPLPVKPIMVGKETFFRPDKDEIDRLFRLIWGISEKEREGNLKVIVLNGSGVPGAGGDAAERLIEIDCRVVETENANNFDYDKTQIIIYKGVNKWAAKIKETLGTGVIVRQDIPQDLADVTVVVGKDYQLKKGN